MPPRNLLRHSQYCQNASIYFFLRPKNLKNFCREKTAPPSDTFSSGKKTPLPKTYTLSSGFYPSKSEIKIRHNFAPPQFWAEVPPISDSSFPLHFRHFILYGENFVNPPTTANFYTHPIPVGSTLTPVCFLNISIPFCTQDINVRETVVVIVALLLQELQQLFAAMVAATVAAVFLL